MIQMLETALLLMMWESETTADNSEVEKKECENESQPENRKGTFYITSEADKTSENNHDSVQKERNSNFSKNVVATNPNKNSVEPDSSQNDHDSLQKERNSNISIEVDANDANERSSKTGEEGKTSDSAKKDKNGHMSDAVDATNGNKNSLEPGAW